LDEGEFLDKTVDLICKHCDLIDLHFLKDDIVPKKHAEFLEALGGFHSKASELTKAASGGVDPEEVKANIKKLTHAFFSTWKLDESEFLDKVLQICSQPSITVDLHFLKEDVVPKKHVEFLEALEVYHKAVSAELARLGEEDEGEREPDPVVEERPTYSVLPEALADTGVPFYLKSETEHYMCMHRWYMHSEVYTNLQINTFTWEELILEPDNSLLGRWTLHKVPGTTDRFTISPWTIPEHNVNYKCYVGDKHEAKVDIQFRVEKTAIEHAYNIIFIKEKRKLSSGNAYGHETKCLALNECGPHNLKDGTWKFLRAPCTLRRRIPQIENFVSTQIPWHMIAYTSGMAIHDQRGTISSTNDYDNLKMFYLVKAIWDGKPGYRILDNSTGNALCWNYPIVQVGGSNKLQIAEEKKPGQFVPTWYYARLCEHILPSSRRSFYVS